MLLKRINQSIRQFRAHIDKLPSKIESKIAQFLSAVQAAIHTISQFALTVLKSTIAVAWEIRKVAYVFLGLTVILAAGIEFVLSDTIVGLKVIGWLMIGIASIVALICVCCLVSVPWDLTPAEDRRKETPFLFFVLFVATPLGGLLFVTTFTPIRFQHFPLRPIQEYAESVLREAKATIVFAQNSHWIAPPFRQRRSVPPLAKIDPPAQSELPETIFRKTEASVVQPKITLIEFRRARVICIPEFAHTREWVENSEDPDRAPQNRLDLRITGIESNDEYTTVHLAATIHDGQELALLEPANGTYLTDDRGKRHDLEKDTGDYSTNGFREVKFKEQYAFDLVFPVLEKRVRHVYLCHPQFAILRGDLVWLRPELVTSPQKAQ